jgi:formiminotetrahydrofolate cyclodeaminase
VPVSGAPRSLSFAALVDQASFTDLLDRLAARTPAPGGGAAAAWACALAAGLVEMAASFAEDADAAGRARELRAEVLVLAERDGEAYAAALTARREGGDVAAAMAGAAEPPLRIAEAAAEIAELAAAIAVTGKASLVGDAMTGALLAEAAARAATRLAEMDLDAAGPAAPAGAFAQAHVAARRAASAREQALSA